MLFADIRNARSPLRVRDLRLRSLPGPPARVTQLGTLRTMLSDGPLVALERWAREAGGPVFVHWVGTRPHVVVSGPDAVRAVILDDTGAFVRNSEHTPLLFGRGILALGGSDWRRSRDRLDPFFKKGQVDAALPIIRARSRALLDTWAAADGPIRPTRGLSEMMLSILGRWLFRFPFDEHPELLEGVSKAFVVLTTELVKRHFAPFPYWGVVPDARVQAAHARVMRLMEEVVRHRQRLPPGDDLLGNLLAAEAAGELQRQDVLDELATLIVAGHETSATALAWTLASLARHPDVAAACRAEAVPLAGQDLGVAQVMRLGPIRHAMSEAMRLYPAVPFALFRTTRPTRLAGFDLPADTRVDVLSFLTHRDPTIWPDPMAFRPGRFAGRNPPATAYYPFLQGPHTCLGKHLALLEMGQFLVEFLARFELEDFVGELEPRMRVSLHPKGLALKLRPCAQGPSAV